MIRKPVTQTFKKFVFANPNLDQRLTPQPIACPPLLPALRCAIINIEGRTRALLLKKATKRDIFVPHPHT